MENQQEYINDLKEIKDIMNRSTRFMSLSGLSGVSAGICALIGAYFAYEHLYKIGYERNELATINVNYLILIGALTFVSAVVSSFFFTHIEAKKNGQKLWDMQVKRLVGSFLIPLGTGGILTLILVAKGFVGLAAPLTLIFYGLALVNGSKYTFSDIKSLGILEIVLGLLATQFIGFGIYFWAVGFGVLHIAYGIYMYFTNNR
ncbi:hypothetical protein KMW28_17335 [Flammeovirga yaeyamensis]|uniref:Brp/Blh family beta-carotene 15,15'-monooxygenase n=1 Tax=Flammeovirga yaeyamensis TaxID=367791 RepID=A0AAX1N1V4_9BACT|nr:hypothetical protein [Flammeovirga yaeyamensis]MBB3698217.1 hypothetical protein [Flammeovirga yaeyamensis]NMF34428.1 hypothetical protein [Flammeovirga yaeyamensis]QWG01407.1 hypothetical protein KMW28_17335 [Flammeovirga yaeyamensis]